MKLVLSGYYGFHNVGDEAILLSIITALRKVKKDCEITVLSNDPVFTEKEYGVQAVNRWQMKEVWKTLKQADGLISGGGSLLQDKTGMNSVLYYLGVVKMAQMVKKPTFVYAQGIGPVEQRINRLLIKWTLSKVNYVSVRDVESKQLLESIGVKKEIDLVPDPVLGFSYTPRNGGWLEGQGLDPKKVVTVSVREWHAKGNFKEKMATALDEVSRSGMSVVFIPMHGKHDDETSKEMMDKMENRTLVFPHDASIEEKMAVIGDSALLVGMRLHALIFSAITGTAMVGLSYDPKIDSFLQQANQPMVGHVDGDWTAGDLSQLILHQYNHLEEEESKLIKAIGPLKQKAEATAEKVIRGVR
jgi:polysaccharide pyruvyl transferase CsaB